MSSETGFALSPKSGVAGNWPVQLRLNKFFATKHAQSYYSL